MTKQFYENYWEGQNDYLSDFSLKWPKLKKFIPLGGSMIVDFGCGNGKILGEIKKINQKAKLIGLDVSETAIEQAEKDLSDVEFYKVNDGEKFPVKDNSVDFIFSSEVIEHIYDTENAFKEIARVLRPDGKVLFTTPYHGFIKNLLITFFAFNKHFNPTGAHIRFFSKKTLLDLLNKNNLTPVKIGYYGRIYPISHSIFVLAEKN
ncbi:MAG: class I SAM-dependent methyltransferase [bacterium]|nr:class I SAM-dependent methyltransferase [bacterium]